MSKINDTFAKSPAAPSVKDRIKLFESLSAKTKTSLKIKKASEQVIEEELQNYPSTLEDEGFAENAEQIIFDTLNSEKIYSAILSPEELNSLSESLQSSDEAKQFALNIVAKDGFAFYKSALLYDLQLADLLTDFVRKNFPKQVEEANDAIVEIGASDYFRSMLEDDEQDKEIFDNIIAYDATIGEKIAQKIREKEEASQKIAKAFSGNKSAPNEPGSNENGDDAGYMTLGEFDEESPNSTMIIKSKASLEKSQTNSIGDEIDDGGTFIRR